MDIVNKIAMSLPTSKKKKTWVLGMHILEYRQIVNHLYQMTWKENDFKWDPEQEHVFENTQQAIGQSIARGLDRIRCKKYVLYCIQ